jgi:hypothetical protein
MQALKILTSLSCRRDTVTQACWYNNANKEARFRWLIGTQTSWIMIITVGEVGAFLIILEYRYLAATHEVRL